MSFSFVDLMHRDHHSVKHAFGDVRSGVAFAKENGLTHYATANYGEISNWAGQLSHCSKHGIVPILGIELYVNNYRVSDVGGRRVVLDTRNGETVSPLDMDCVERDKVTQDYPLCLYARTVEGYHNIIAMHNDAQLNGMSNRPRTCDAVVERHGKGVSCVMGVPYSEVASLVFNGLEDEALERMRYYEGVFDDVTLTVAMVDGEEYPGLNDSILSFADRHGFRVVPVCNSHYVGEDDREAFCVLRKLSHLRGGTSYDTDIRDGMHYRTWDELDELYERRFRSGVFTERKWEELKSELERFVKGFGELAIDRSLKLPKFKDGAETLARKANEGFVRLGYDRKGEEYRKRLEYELDNIVGAGFADYFLVLEEFYNWYRHDFKSVCAFGRGSAAGSLVLNCIGCTNVDPIRHNLLFERFLDAERFKMVVQAGGSVSGADCPDVDSDFATTKRDALKQHIVDVYGKNCTASIGTIGLMKTKSTLKDLARLYEVPAEEVNAVTVKIDSLYADSQDEYHSLEDLKAEYPELNSLLEKYPKMGDTFEKLRGTITNLGIHAGGVLITDFDLTDQLPLRLGADGQVVTCWTEGISGRELGDMGFVKFDILAIDQLNLMEHTVELIRENRGVEVDVSKIPLDDRKALSLMSRHDGSCIFQFDTELAGKVTDHMGGIETFEDLGSLSTLMRPAALSNGFDVEFGERRAGRKKSEMPDCLKPYLESTYGLPIYQEHIMQSAMALAGFDKNTAYKFMKLIYKGKLHTKEEKDEWRERFVRGCMPKVRHEAIEVEFEDGTRKTYEKWERVACDDGTERTVAEAVELGIGFEP